jgi:Protein kinase domain
MGLLGTGGFATVHRSWQYAVGREVAIKVDNRVLLDERDRRRFVREVTAAGRLSGHPHVIDVYDAGTLADGRPYMVMELCPAGSLNDALRRRGPMSPAQVRDIGVRIGDALAAAHAAGVLHRDIKPANILVNRYGLVGLSDFGLASIMAAGGEQSASREALTPAYASPETFRWEEPTVVGDVYSLAATLYALLAGRPPRFPADARSPGIAAIIALHDRPVDDVPGTPPELMTILRRGLAADPAARPPSAAALRDALAALPAQPGRPAQPGNAAQPARPPQAVRSPGPGTTAPPAMRAGPRVMPARPTVAPAPSVPRSAPPWPGREDVPAGVAPPGHVRGGVPGSVAGEVPPGSGRRRIAAGAVPPGQGRGGPAGAVPPGQGRASPDGVAPPGPGRAGPAGPGRGSAPAGRVPAAPVRRRRPAVLLAAAVTGLALLGAAAVVGARLLPRGAGDAAPPAASSASGPSTGPAAAPAVFGIPTVTSGCPAASVSAADARCPRDPECWNGLVMISGSVTASSMPCTRPHVWQTFAIAILPASVQTFNRNVVRRSPAVDAVCSMRVLLASRRGAARQIPRVSWQVEVMPPDEAAFDSGARAYRCVAHQTGTDPSTSEFGPQAEQGGRGQHAHGGGPGSGKNG